MDHNILIKYADDLYLALTDGNNSDIGWRERRIDYLSMLNNSIKYEILEMRMILRANLLMFL